MKILSTALDYHLPAAQIGQGNFGTVYLADDPQIGGRRALKVIPKSTFGDPKEYFSEAQSMFAAEHSNVVPIVSASAASDSICLAMPYFKNGSLDRRIQSVPLRVIEVIRIGQDILNGLSHIHLAGRVHFDVKPSNILFSDTWNAMVADFGQAKAIEANGLAEVPGMYRFTRPPETIGSAKASLQCDIYQAGLTLYRAVNGDPFWKSQIPALPIPAVVFPLIQSGALPNRDRFLPHVPRRLRTVLRKAMSLNPTDRYNSASAFADALGKVAPRLDWSVSLLPGDGLQWQAVRNSQPTLVVTLERSGTSAWNVCFYTEGKGGRRARDENRSWLKNASRSAAESHLKALFADLEQGHRSRQSSATQ